jgi:hypothetical protein
MAKYKNIKSAVHNFGYSFLNGLSTSDSGTGFDALARLNRSRVVVGPGSTVRCSRSLPAARRPHRDRPRPGRSGRGARAAPPPPSTADPELRARRLGARADAGFHLRETDSPTGSNHVPSSPKRVYFLNVGASAWIYRDPARLDQEFKERWGETGDAAGFRADEAEWWPSSRHPRRSPA